MLLLMVLLVIVGIIMFGRRAVGDDSVEQKFEPSTNSLMFPTPGNSSSSTLFSNESHHNNVGCGESHHGGCDVGGHGGFDSGGHH